MPVAGGTVGANRRGTASATSYQTRLTAPINGSIDTPVVRVIGQCRVSLLITQLTGVNTGRAELWGYVSALTEGAQPFNPARRAATILIGTVSVPELSPEFHVAFRLVFVRLFGGPAESRQYDLNIFASGMS